MNLVSIHCRKKIGDLRIIRSTLCGFSFLSLANYEIFVGQSKIFKKWNKQQKTLIICMIIGGYWLFLPFFVYFGLGWLKICNWLWTVMKIYVCRLAAPCGCISTTVHWFIEWTRECGTQNSYEKCTSFKACVVLTCKAIKIMMRRRSLKLFLVAPVR